MTQLDSNAQLTSASKDADVLSLLSNEPPAPASTPESNLNNSPIEASAEAASSNTSLNNLSLKDLINPALLERLNKIDEAHLANLSLKELLTEVTKDAIAGPWQITNPAPDAQRLEASYELSASWKARYILSDILGKAFSLMLAPEELSLNKTDEGYTLKIVVLNKTSDKSKAALAFTQYVNFKMTCESSDDCYYDEYADPTAKDQQQLATPTLDIPEQAYEQFVSCTSRIELVDESETEAGIKKIKLAAAKLGKWKHPIYKVVEFTEKDFEDAINNFNNRVLGFEPPLFLGHANNMVNSGTGITYETAEGAPAEGFLLNLYTEDDVLYSEWEIVNDTVYEAVKQRRYRYNSGEFVRGFRTKQDGSNCGMVVIGMALTNRPFVPDLPQAKALTDAQIRPDISSVFRLSFKEDDASTELAVPDPDSAPELESEQHLSSMTVQTTDSELTPTPLTSAFAQTSTESQSLAQLVERQGQELQAVKLAYEKQLAEALSTIQALSTEVESHKAKLKEREIQEKLTWLNKLALPADVKESYTTLIKNGTLGESESAVLETLERTAQAFNQNLTEQQGSTTETQQLNDPLHEDPYKDVIERNNAIANKLRETYLTR